MTEKQTSIGASEFAATLNGDDPNEILRVLKQFAKTVQKERQLALFDEEGESDSDSSDDEEDDLEARPSKKLKKDEQWKEDSASYNVPFVGTAVSRSDVSEVVRGQWPTGLLEAYLNKSPLAIELMNDDISSTEGKIHRSLIRKKYVKTSTAIKKAYLNALAQLLTAIIPIRKLKEMNGEDMGKSPADSDGDTAMVDESIYDKFGKYLPTLLKKRLPDCFELLNEETSSGRGKTGVYGGCGLLVVPVLKLIQYTALTSSTNARLVARYFDERVHQGVLRCLLRPLPPKVNAKMEKEASASDISRRLEVRIEAMNLATILVKTQDTTVNTYICTSGSKERKVKPGILFIALREGLLSNADAHGPHSSGNDEDEEDYMDAVSDLLESFRLLLLNQRKSMNPRLLAELLSGEPVQNLCQLLVHAPTLGGRNTYRSVLNASDAYHDDLESMPNAGVEARRLVFPLLFDATRSPYLTVAKHGKIDVQQVGKIMLSLLWTRNGGGGMQKFLIECARKTPALVPILFRLLSFPDAKCTYDFIVSVHFVSSLFRNGPSVAECLTGNEGCNVQEILPTLFPTKLKKQTLAKLMQSKNALVAMECLVLFHNLLRRLEELQADAANTLKWTSSFTQKVVDAALQLIPDIQVLLKIRTHFDGFSGSKECAIVNERLFRVISVFVKISPSSVQDAQFDWMKLLPNDSSTFFRALPLVQRGLLRTLGLVISVWNCPSHTIFQAFKNIVDIMLRTKQSAVYEESRVIAIGLLQRMLQSRWINADSHSLIQYESECWIDSLTIDSLHVFCSLLRDVADNELQIVAMVGDIWSKCKSIGSMTCSLLLFATWTMTEPDTTFAKLVAQVSTKVMLFHRSPLLVANLIHLANEKSAWSTTSSSASYTKGLVEYAGALCQLNDSDGQVQKHLLGKVLESLFGRDESFIAVFDWIHGQSSLSLKMVLEKCFSTVDLEALARFLIHLHVVSKVEGAGAQRCWTLLLNVATRILSDSISDEKKDALVSDIALCNDSDKMLPILVASSPRLTCTNYTYGRFSELAGIVRSENTDVSARDRQVCLLKFLLVSDSIPMNLVAQSQLEVIASCDPDSKSTLASSNDFMLGFLESTNSIWKGASDCDVETIQSLFLKWWNLASESNHDDHVNIISQMSLALTSILENQDSLSAMVIAMIQSKSADNFVDCCLAQMGSNPAAMSKTRKNEIGLLTAAVRNDSVLLAPSILEKLHHINLSTEMTKEGQDLDILLSVILQRSANSPNDNRTHILEDKVFERTKASLSSIIKGEQEVTGARSTLGLCRLLLRESSSGRVPIIVPGDIVQDFITILKMRTIGLQKYIFDLGSLAIDIIENSKVQIRTQLSSLLFLRLSERLAQSFKEEFKIEDPEQSCLALMVSICKSVKNFDMNIFREVEPVSLPKLVKSCLKYGIGLAGQFPAQSSLSLELVAALLKCFSDPTSQFVGLENQFLGAPVSSVFNLLTSHSKFREVLSSAGPEVEIVKLRLVNLMSYCIEVSPNKIDMDVEVWTSLFQAFDAGLSELDQSIRRLFSICCDLPEEVTNIHVPCMDEFRWKSCVNDGKSDKVNWDWLVQAIDPVRLRATVTHFPIHETLNSNSASDDEPDESEIEDSESSSDGMDVDEGTVRTQSRVVVKATACQDVWTGDRNDLRYSPAFLLPLVLGALESTLPSRDEWQENAEAVYDPMPEAPTQGRPSRFNDLVRVVKKLCDAGIHGLCLAALGSECEGVRRLAFAVLGVLLLGCTSQEARIVSSWRSRPQVAMLLNSVQRAFVIKKATNKVAGVDLVVPRLSPLVSTFLARASSSIHKADDPLFVPLNRFFLKSEKDHGAFQDMNRLPGFISLFCSVADDAGQSRQERMWALQLVRDGFRDTSCYRLIAECHAPELILTSFENLRLSQTSDAMKDAEYALMMTVFKKLFLLGSDRVMSHLLSRIGLLSWIRSWCTTWPLEVSFPRSSSRVALCELIGCVAEQSCINGPPRTDSFLYELCALVQPMILLGIRTRTTDEGSSRLIAAVCDALQCIKQCVTKHKAQYVLSDIQPLGVSIKTSLEFYKLLGDDDDRVNAAFVAVNTVPLQTDHPDQDELASFTSLLLDACLQSAGSRSHDQDILMNRILLIQNSFGAEAMSSSDILKKLLAVRPTLITSKQRLDTFNLCLRGIVSLNKVTGIEHEIALKLQETTME